MTAPTYTSRSTPVGNKLNDGFSALITFAADPDVSFWEKSVKPPGVDGGEPIDTTTMHNDDWRTRDARALLTLTQSGTRVAYDPRVYDQIVALINVPTTITVTFGDSSQLAYYGFLRSFEPAELVEGQQAEAQCQIEPTNEDPITGEEEGPNYRTAAGTDS